MVIVPCSARAVTPMEIVPFDNLQILALEKINNVRSDPWAEVERQGGNIEELRSGFDRCSVALWDSGFASVNLNRELSETANDHAGDMLERLYYNSISPEGITPEQRALDNGYSSVFVNEYISGIAFFNMISSEDALTAVLDNLIRDAVLNGSMADTMLSPFVQDVGIGFQGGTIVIDGVFYNVYLLVLDYARPAPVGHDSVWGHLFKDTNMNGRYDTGEGVADMAVTLHGHELFSFSPAPSVYKTLCSGNDGMFIFDVLPGFYDIEAGGIVTGVTVPVTDEMHRVDILLY